MDPVGDTVLAVALVAGMIDKFTSAFTAKPSIGSTTLFAIGVYEITGNSDKDKPKHQQKKQRSHELHGAPVNHSKSHVQGSTL
jgi:hypothetical protein